MALDPREYKQYRIYPAGRNASLIVEPARGRRSEQVWLSRSEVQQLEQILHNAAVRHDKSARGNSSRSVAKMIWEDDDETNRKMV